MAESPSDPDLWNMVRACLREVLQHVSADGGDRDTASRLLNLAVDDLSTLPGLISEIKARPNARAKLELPKAGADDEWVVLPHEAAQIPLTLATNALQKMAGAAATDDELLRDYLPYERYLLSDPSSMPAEIVVPIMGVEPQELSAHDGSSSVQRFTDEQRAVFASSDAREHVAKYDIDALDSPSMCFFLRGGKVRVEGFGKYHFAHLSDETELAVERFFEALTVASPRSAAWAEFAVIPAGWSAWPSTRSGPVSIVRHYTARIDQIRGYRYDTAPTELDAESSELAMQINDRLGSCDRSVRVAATRYRRALARDNDDDRVVDLCIAIEALFGSGSAEIVHRLSMRTAAILGKLWQAPTADLYKATKDLYNHRSKVVHGSAGDYEEGMISFAGGPRIHVSRFGSAAVSSILRHAILDPEFEPKTVDDRYLFSALDAALAQSRESGDEG